MSAMCRLLLLLPASLIVSCSMPNLLASSAPYKIKLRDGREVMSTGQPHLQEKTGYYYYRTQDKREAVIRADEVVMIKEQRA